MATQTFTVGSDATAVLIGPDGTRIDMPKLTKITVKPMYDKVKITPLNTPPEQRELPAGHDVTLGFERVDGTVEAYFSQIESSYWSGGTAAGGTGSTGALFVYISNYDGSQTTRNYQKLSLSFDDSGDFSGPKSVPQQITGFAGQCVVTNA